MTLHDGLGNYPAADGDETPERYRWDDYPANAKCEVCGKHGPVTRHHVVYRQHVRNYGGDQWDPDNSMLVGNRYGRCTCHARHHAGGRGRIPLNKVPERAKAFAVRLMGPAAATYYFRRYYAPAEAKT